MLRIYKRPQFLTLHADRMSWQVNAHIFRHFLVFSEKNTKNSMFAWIQILMHCQLITQLVTVLILGCTEKS